MTETTSATPPSSANPTTHGPHTPEVRSRWVPVWITTLVAATLAGGAVLLRRAEADVNDVALASEPKPVTVVQARSAQYQGRRRYVGTVEPWQRAELGPQLVSGFVQSVLVRPGDRVKRGQVLATLDCRNASAASKAISMQARALEEQQRAAAQEAARIKEMQASGYVSPNELEQTLAKTAAAAAQIQALLAQASGKQLEVDDCVLRAPFDGEVAERRVDPGAFARPGSALLTVVDRSLVRLSAHVPEVDFEVVAPGKTARIRLLATGDEFEAPIARRSPAADPATRTIHFEIDLSDVQGRIPVGTTVEITIDAGDARPALKLPLPAATVRGSQASAFIIREGRAEQVALEVLGERDGSLFVRPTIEHNASLVLQGRNQLFDGDLVAQKSEAW